ncbi:T9SS type A sorting domain-containing protein [Lacinutrix mariniflava]|uniref:T9SS type A sorting domain-containing protein n=1 Tax=Lacinutrix mariniflava TaxID=342955 RepID=UPI0006E11E42|nr:T9SS type A sorting domain-containing protein [Lacinutrix mariniflava]
MKKIYLLGFLLTSLFYTNAQNIISNSGFENFTGNTPDSWTLETGYSTAPESSITIEGSKSLKVNLTTTDSENTDLNKSVTVIGDKVYDVSVSVYHLSTDNDARVALVVNGFETYSDPTITDQWQTVSTTYTQAANASIQVGFRFLSLSGFDGSSTMYIDNSSMIEKATLSTQNFEKATFSMFPNPTTDSVNIKTASNVATQVSVFDILGKQVINTTLNTERLDVSALKSGVYTVRLSQGNTTSTKKLVIK